MEEKDFIKYSYREFKNSINSVEDFPSLEEFVNWINYNRDYMSWAINHLIYIMKKDKKMKRLPKKKTEG